MTTRFSPARFTLATVLLLSASVLSLNAQDLEGSADHPLLKRNAEFSITEYTLTENDVTEYWVASLNRNVKMGGRTWRIVYTKKEASKTQFTPASLVNDLVNKARAAGMTVENQDAAGYVTARVTRGATETWIRMDVWSNGDAFLYLVTEKPADRNPYREPDQSDAKDHPLFSRMTNYHIREFNQADYDGDGFYIAETQQEVRVEGRFTSIVYAIRPDLMVRNASATQIVKNYANAAKKAGFSIENEDVNGYLTVKKGPEGRQIWARLDVWSNGESYRLNIVEQTEMTQEVNAAAMQSEIERSGRMALYINFDTGSYAVPPDAEALLNEIVSLMDQNPEWNIAIEGHTDNTGAPDGNLRLSDARAQSIREALIAKGVAPARLTAKGYGRTRPLTDNSTDEARAKNRRVELVKQ